MFLQHLFRILLRLFGDARIYDWSSGLQARIPCIKKVRKHTFQSGLVPTKYVSGVFMIGYCLHQTLLVSGYKGGQKFNPLYTLPEPFSAQACRAFPSRPV